MAFVVEWTSNENDSVSLTVTDFVYVNRVFVRFEAVPNVHCAICSRGVPNVVE